MNPLFFAQILPADSAAGSELKEAIGAATQPLNLDVKHWFSRSMLEEWLNAGINFGLRSSSDGFLELGACSRVSG